MVFGVYVFTFSFRLCSCIFFFDYIFLSRMCVGRYLFDLRSRTFKVNVDLYLYIDEIWTTMEL